MDRVVPRGDTADRMKQDLETINIMIGKFMYESPSGDRVNEILEKGISFTGATGPHAVGEHEVPPGIVNAPLVDYDQNGKLKSDDQLRGESQSQFINEEEGNQESTMWKVAEKVGEVADKIGETANKILGRK